MLDVAVLDEPKSAAAALDPIRGQVLAALAEPGSATTVANELGIARQKANYHLRALEELGLVTLVEERPRRGLTERVVRASARSYVVSPSVLGPSAASPDRVDHLSAQFLIALGGRLIREVGRMCRLAEAADQTIATFAIDTEITFASPAQRSAFAADLSAAVAEVVARHHDDRSADGRRHRLIVAAHPNPPDQPEEPNHDRP